MNSSVLPFEGDKTMARQDSKRDRLDTLEKKLSASRQRHQPDDNQPIIIMIFVITGVPSAVCSLRYL